MVLLCTTGEHASMCNNQTGGGDGAAAAIGEVTYGYVVLNSKPKAAVGAVKHMEQLLGAMRLALEYNIDPNRHKTRNKLPA
eukprot:COSAG02_NODE_14168_length_1302_cov_0.800499_1_plen_80_part_10